MENAVFITTAVICALFTYTLDQISRIQCIIQKYYTFELSLRAQLKHIMKCILYKPIKALQPINGINIRSNQNM